MTGPAYDARRLPADLVASARQAAGTAPVPPRDASTVVLLRDGARGPEAFLLRRVPTMAFAAGRHVFPGGSVDPRDEALPDTAWAGPPAVQWAGVLSAGDRLARALVCAAVRETFEESGVLLAGPSAAAVVPDTSAADWEADRRGLLDRSLSLAELLDRRGLVLRADLLRPWAHWITPDGEPKRFDTRFFVAALPAGQSTRDVGGESDVAEWARPDDVLDRAQRGEVDLMPPTSFTLGELAAYGSVAEVLAAATARDIRPVLPRIVVDGEDAALLLPGDPGYRP